MDGAPSPLRAVCRNDEGTTDEGTGGQDAAHGPDAQQEAGKNRVGARFDQLAVFQAAPLVWKDDEGVLHSISMLDFEQEREILSESLQYAARVGAEIDLVFETATTDRLGAFLATSETKVIHFSCHGYPEYLCFEDGSGGVQFLQVEDLRELMALGEGDLQFVFVSACYSRAAGEAFVKAGVPHVLCCQQDEELMDVSTVEFARNFYRALACGKKLQKAFELGKQAVKLSPLVPDSENEMRKFLLLPEGADHDVPILYTTPRRAKTSLARASTRPPWILPHPPQKFIGREVDMYKLLQAMRSVSRLIRLSGPQGIGKVSLAAAVCQYIKTRRSSFFIEEIIWLPLITTSRGDDLNSSFHRLFGLLRNDNDSVCLDHDECYQGDLGVVIDELHQKKVLLVIEVKEFLNKPRIEKLSRFLQDLFRGTKHVKVVLVSRERSPISVEKNCVECEIVLGPLGFEATAMLFGMVCPYVSGRRCAKASTPRQLSKLLVPNGQESVIEKMSNRSSHVFRAIGSGIPSDIHAAARNMKAHDYDGLIEIGERKDKHEDYHSRVELELHFSQLETELRDAVNVRDFTRAEEVHQELDELKSLRATLPHLDELYTMEKILKERLESAILLKDFTSAKKIQEELSTLGERIKNEEMVPVEKHISAGQNAADGKKEFSTRADLEEQIGKLERQMAEACQNRNFEMARDVQRSIAELARYRIQLPSSTELASKIQLMNNDLEVAIGGKDFFAAESLHRELVVLTEKLASEQESEAQFSVASAQSAKMEQNRSEGAGGGKEGALATPPKSEEQRLSETGDTASMLAWLHAHTIVPFSPTKDNDERTTWKRSFSRRAQLFVIVCITVVVLSRIFLVDGPSVEPPSAAPSSYPTSLRPTNFPSRVPL